VKSIALITPWPPQHSGIADYAFDLALGLVAQGMRVGVFTSADDPVIPRGIEVFGGCTEQVHERLKDFDCAVYQFGNNTHFHLWMLEWAQRSSGVVQLHDMVMHHIYAWQTWMEGNTAEYIAGIGKWYGDEAADYASQSLREARYIWDSERVIEFPLFEKYVQGADLVITHSRFALQHVRRAFPNLPAAQLPQIYNVEPRAEAPTALRNIAVLGGVDPQKRLDWILEAVSLLRKQGIFENSARVVMYLTGGIDDRCRGQVENLRSLAGDGFEVVVEGRVEAEAFAARVRSADLCIALRYPTMGETSAVVMRCLQTGVPLIVNDIGWYGEIEEEHVIKLDVSDTPNQLSQKLAELISNPAAYQALAERALRAARGYSMSRYVARFISQLNDFRADELLLNELATVSSDLNILPCDEALIEGLFRSL
jgi:glycosyltransferase involved in cell wall biosynthesis